jgi:hypothetical protein
MPGRALQETQVQSAAQFADRLWIVSGHPLDYLQALQSNKRPFSRIAKRLRITFDSQDHRDIAPIYG